EDHVVRAVDAAVDPPQPIRGEAVRLEVLRLHHPPDRVLAEEQAIELPDRDPGRLLVHPAQRLELPAPPDLDALGIETRAPEHVGPDPERDVEVPAERADPAERALAAGREGGRERIELDDTVERVRRERLRAA